MPECCDAKLLQMLFRQARKNRLIYFVLAKCRLILPEAQARSQTTMSMTAPTQRCRDIIVRSGQSVQDVQRRVVQCQSVLLSK